MGVHAPVKTGKGSIPFALIKSKTAGRAAFAVRPAHTVAKKV
jgi:hypothetical protein